MARPKKVHGDKRDGFINYRIPPEVSLNLNTLAYLFNSSVGEVVRLALTEFINKHAEAVKAIETIRLQHKEHNGPTSETQEQT